MIINDDTTNMNWALKFKWTELKCKFGELMALQIHTSIKATFVFNLIKN